MASEVSPPQGRAARPVGNGFVALLCVVFVAAMVGAAFAAVPFYRWFCQTTGFGGTPVRAESAAAIQPIGRSVTVRFDANVSGNLAWQFRPTVESVTVRLGEVHTVDFEAQNLTARPITGTSTFNVTPTGVGAYFNKIQCFCFTEQTLKPGEKLTLPVVFYVDPAMDKDAELDSVRDITLSYTFFPAAKQPVAGNEAAGAGATQPVRKS
ncbi:cytochrome c oxidase assembly protein subunit 11 [Pseudoxanthobacter soli DSM 19599]|uniref:Cytochrome c oxidase assembly protein CtaG n=2 Tax=Pseudoxanthobacter TaxID=433838 RepID=A0A1M7Z4Z1_9HYPH|nr:cytochrome c oxidase assembly protein [Pseudoxanthobacter soli]SHO60008.1 cytochrome c oxidase assembly protein subunit 11 [Pseudoxanthobacter soli DSM 19599]